MANSKYEYVRDFEFNQILLPNTYIVVRIDGKGFHQFSETYKFSKPNDKNALDLMNKAAQTVMQTFKDIFLAYGQSDEYSFVFKQDTTLYNRRSDKICSIVCSLFTSSYVQYFEQFMNQNLKFPNIPVFDSRCVCYPNKQNLRDYFSWRQVDCHINNLYNTCFWKLVESGKTKQQSEEILGKTNSGQKNELLFSEFGINYNNIDEQFKKGSILVRVKDESGQKEEGVNLTMNEEEQKLSRKQRKKQKQQQKEKQQEKDNQFEQQQNMNEKTIQSKVIVVSEDLINEQFWIKYGI